MARGGWGAAGMFDGDSLFDPVNPQVAYGIDIVTGIGFLPLDRCKIERNPAPPYNPRLM